MNALAKLAIDAHGGLDRWKQFEKLSAHLVQGGVLWQLKGQAGTLDDTNLTIGLRTEWDSHYPFGAPGRKSRFEPNRVAIEAADGTVVEELLEPRKSFAGHTLQTPWTNLQLAYFVGTAMWTYLNMPFVLAWPGVTCEELSSWSENGDSWRRLQVNFPDSIATHCSRQTVYFDKDGFLKRHDYDVEIAGNTPGAHYMDGYVEASGIKFPTTHRIFARQPDGTANREPLVVSIDVSNIQLT
jgi:hypothetical protein